MVCWYIEVRKSFICTALPQSHACCDSGNWKKQPCTATSASIAVRTITDGTREQEHQRVAVGPGKCAVHVYSPGVAAAAAAAASQCTD